MSIRRHRSKCPKRYARTNLGRPLMDPRPAPFFYVSITRTVARARQTLAPRRRRVITRSSTQSPRKIGATRRGHQGEDNGSWLTVNRNDDPSSHGEARSMTIDEKTCGHKLLIPSLRGHGCPSRGLVEPPPPPCTRGAVMKSTWSLMAEILLLFLLSTLSASATMMSRPSIR
jgi:hypothetical protein